MNNNKNTDSVDDTTNKNTDSVIYVKADDTTTEIVDIKLSSIDEQSSNANVTYFFGKITDIFEFSVKVMVMINGIKEWIYVSRSRKRWFRDELHTNNADLPNDIILYVGTFVSLKIGEVEKDGYRGDDVMIIMFNLIPEYQYRFFAGTYSIDTYYWIRRFIALQNKLKVIYNGTQNHELKEYIGSEYGNKHKSMYSIIFFFFIRIY